MSFIQLNLPRKLRKSIEKHAELCKITKEAYIIKLLEAHTTPSEFIKKTDVIQTGLNELVSFLGKIPGVSVISSSQSNKEYWWVKLEIDIKHKLAWVVVQNLGFVLNYISLTSKLPTVFMPVSPPPYLNGGPLYYLSWVLESRIAFLDPRIILKALQERLPENMDNERDWESDEEDEESIRSNISYLRKFLNFFFKKRK